MKILLASAVASEIEWAVEHGLADGVLLPPARLNAERPGADTRELIAELTRATTLPVHVSVGSVDPSDMHRDGRELSRLGDHVIVHVPLVDDAVVAIRRLASEGVRVAATLVFSAAQALLASKAGASAVTVPVDQLDALGQDSTLIVAQIREVFDRGAIECDLIAGYPSSTTAFTACARCGVDAAIVDMTTIRSLLVHPLTDRGVDGFLRDLSTRPRPRIAPV